MGKQACEGGLRRNLWPLPGGRHCYAQNLRQILRLSQDAVTIADLARLVHAEFEEVESEKTARGYAKVPIALRMLISHPSSAVALSPEGSEYLRTGDHAVVRKALVENITGVRSILLSLEADADDFRSVRACLREEGLHWSTPMPVRYRIWWLTSVGAIVATQAGRRHTLSLTSQGRQLI